MNEKKRGLGRGLNALINTGPDIEVKEKSKDNNDNKEVFVNISLVEPNRNQPRKEFDKEALSELAASIKQYGILQPIMVQKNGDMYEIIAGERRWRAAKEAGLKEVPVIVRDYDKQKIMEISIIENIQRENLNPIEEAMAYQCLMEEYGLKHDELADKVSKNRSTITNSMRLLRLSENIQQMIIDGKISTGHAKVLLSVENKEEQEKKDQEKKEQEEQEKKEVFSVLEREHSGVVNLGFDKYIVLSFKEGRPEDYKVEVDGTDITEALTAIDTAGKLWKWESTVVSPKNLTISKKDGGEEKELGGKAYCCGDYRRHCRL